MDYSMYATLKEKIRLISNTEGERYKYITMLMLYFEGKIPATSLPEPVFLALMEWEREHIEENNS